MPMRDSFSAVEAASLAGLPYSRVDYWARSGLIQPSIARAGGRGTERKYSFRDLVALRAARELRDARISAQTLRKVIDRLREQAGLENPLAEARLLIAGDDVVWARDGVFESLHRSPGQTCLAFLFDVPKAVEELKEKIARLAA
jgi:DNA-binding transcriptional MerR regulator